MDKITFFDANMDGANGIPTVPTSFSYEDYSKLINDAIISYETLSSTIFNSCFDNCVFKKAITPHPHKQSVLKPKVVNSH